MRALRLQAAHAAAQLPPRRPGRDAHASAAARLGRCSPWSPARPLPRRTRARRCRPSATCSCWCSRISPTTARSARSARTRLRRTWPVAAGAGRAAHALLRHRPCESAQLRGDGERPGAERADAARLSQLRGVRADAPRGPDAHGQLPGAGCVYPRDGENAARSARSGRPHLEGLHGGHGQRPGARAGRLRRTCRWGSPRARNWHSVGDQYAAKHDPFVYFHSIIDDRARCDAHVVNLARLPRICASAATTANYVFITPNLCNDGHDAACVDGRRRRAGRHQRAS